MKQTRQKRIEVSCDSAARLQTATQWIESYSSDTEIVVIAHRLEAANDLCLRVANSRSAWFGIRRYTLNGLAARLAQLTLTESGRASASTLSFVAVVARAIHSLQAEGKLTYFAPVATRPGFPAAVAKTLAELRMNEVDVQTLERLARGGKDLAQIARAVEDELERAKLADRAVMFRAAIQSIQSNGNTSLLDVPLLLLDVQVRDRLELELLREIAERSPDVLALVPQGDEQTAAKLEEALVAETGEQGNGGTGEQRDGGTGRRGEGERGRWGDGETGGRGDAGMGRRGDVSTNSLSLAKQHLFADTAPSISPLDESVRLASWPGEPRECVEIVRNIQTEAARGMNFDQMAVFLNCPGEYRSHLEEAFSRASIPVYFAEGSTAPDPAGRAMLALLSCAAEGLSARRFAEYLSLGQVPNPDAAQDPDSKWAPPKDELVAPRTDSEDELPNDAESKADGVVAESDERPVIDGSLRAPWRWEHLLVDSAVIGGKDRWVRRLDGLANELRLRLTETEEDTRTTMIERELRDLGHLKEYALPLIDRLANLPKQATWGEWLNHLQQLASVSLREPAGVLATLAELEPMAPVGPIDLYEVQMVLGPRLRELSSPPPRRRYGSVFVAPVEFARGLSFKVVFLPGLAERIFPRKIVEDPILPDGQRREAAAASLATRHDRLELERLGLKLAVGAAGERVYLSYPRIDVQQSRPRVPSFYALEALRAAEGSLPSFEQITSRAESTTRARLGWPAPERAEHAIDEAEYDLALLASLVGASEKDATGRAHYLLTANNHLARALRGRSRRWLRRWTPNDGLVDPDELARQSIARHQFSARSFSATALQNYGSCPYRFFLSAILRLELRQEPAAIEVLDPLTRGSLFHEVQFEVLTKLKAAGLLPLVGASLRGRPMDHGEGGPGDEGRSREEGRPRRDAPTVLDREGRPGAEGRPRRDAPTVEEGRTRDEGRPGDEGRPRRDAPTDIACDLVDRALDRLAQEYEDQLAPAIPRVWQDGINSIRADLREWLRRSADSDDGWVPDKFELSFGLTDRGPRNDDPDSVVDPVEIVGDLKLRGSVDLVERHSSGKFRVTDHKTGKARAVKGTIVGGGKHLQPLLYALACERLLNRPVESGRLYYCTADGGYEERIVPLDEFNREMITSVVTKIGQALADGFLPAAPEEGACAWCDFRAVCGGLEEIRTARKPGKRIEQLTQIRGLP